MKAFPRLIALAFLFLGAAFADNDPGQKVVGELLVELIHATENEPGEVGTALDAASIAALQRVEVLKFAHYKKLGVDTKNVLRGYQNWAFPMKGSQRLMLSFQPLGELSGKSLRLDLELWQEKKKILKADPVIEQGKPLYILGPEWRGGNIILAVTLTRVS